MKMLVKIPFIIGFLLLSELNTFAQEIDSIPSVDIYEVCQDLNSAGLHLEKSGRNGYTGLLLQSAGVALVLLPELENVNTPSETYYIAAGMIVTGIVFQVVSHVRKMKAGKILQNISVSDSGIGLKVPIK